MNKDNYNLSSIQPLTKKVGRFLRIPKFISEDKFLTDSEIHYYSLIYDRATYENRGWCRQTHQKMAEHGFTRSQSRRLLHNLKAKGYLNVIRAKNAFIAIPLFRYQEPTPKANMHIS